MSWVVVFFIVAFGGNLHKGDLDRRPRAKISPYIVDFILKGRFLLFQVYRIFAIFFLNCL